MDNFNKLLSGSHRFNDNVTNGFFFNAFNKLFSDTIIDIGIQQSKSYFADSFSNIASVSFFCPASLEIKPCIFSVKVPSMHSLCLLNFLV